MKLSFGTLLLGVYYLATVAFGLHPVIVGQFDDANGELQVVLLDEPNNVVFAGGRNSLYKFDEKLNLLGKITTGPVLDGLTCDPSLPLVDCNDTQMMDNDAKVLLDNPQVPDTLLFCGSVKQGLCASVDKRTFDELHYLDAGHVYNFMGGKASVSVLVSKYLSDARSPPVYPLYVAQQYDQRPLRLSPPEYSTRYINYSAVTGVMRIDLLRDDANQTSAKDVHPDVKTTYPIRHLTIFEDDKFTYFVAIQRESIFRKAPYGVHVSRMCKDDPNYGFIGARLQCQRGYTSFFLAEDLYFGPVSAQFAHRMDIESGESALILTFGTDRRAIYSWPRERSTGIPILEQHSSEAIYLIQVM